MSEDQRFSPYTNDAVKFGEEMYEDEDGDYVLHEYASRTLLNQRVNSNAVIEELKEDIEELKANLESETKVANSLRLVCKRNDELLKEIAELKEKLKEEEKEWRNAFEVSEHDKDTLNARWGYIKTDIEGARALLILLRDGKGTPDDFDTMVDRIIESRKGDKK